MELSSPVFKNNQKIPQKYTCDGENINPPFDIDNVPDDAKSLALIVEDPEAPGETWSHWILWNISPLTFKIKEGSLPKGVTQGLNDFQKHSYVGPCPPSGIHHYHFRLFALDKIFDFKSSFERKDLEEGIKKNIIESAKLIGIYKR